VVQLFAHLQVADGARKDLDALQVLTSPQYDIDATRAALCSMSWVSARETSPVHTLRITNVARGISRSADVGDSLEKMEDFGEACRLPSGYWLPVRPRLVFLDTAVLLISPNPLSELRRRVGDCEYTQGLGRTCNADLAPSWPHQTVDQWTKRPPSLRQWTEDWLLKHQTQLQPTRADTERLEYYSGQPRSTRSRRRWLPLKERSPSASRDQLLLLRERAGNTTLRYLIGTCRGKNLERETTLQCDVIRLQFGIELIAGSTSPLVIQRMANGLDLKLTRALPREERTLLDAVCKVVKNDKIAEIRIPKYAERTCCNTLAKLGFQIEVRDV
jgi:hypothetical protein